MKEEAQALVIEFVDEAAAVATNTEVHGRVIKRENLDGNVASWILVATAAVHTLPKILDSLAKLIEKSKIRSIKYGGMEIRNPTPADLKRIEAASQAKANDG